VTSVQNSTEWSAAFLLRNAFLICQIQSFKQAITKVSDLFIHRVALPDWILRLYATGRKAKLAFEEMEVSILLSCVFITKYTCLAIYA
jgi:hypothetical protein